MALHVAVPLCIALCFYRDRWWRAALVMLATMIVDGDHLLATPIFDPNRCSIGFHPLHMWPAIMAYAIALYPKATRLIGIGLLVHMALDQIDCWMM
jgi:hypothetical protein